MRAFKGRFGIDYQMTPKDDALVYDALIFRSGKLSALAEVRVKRQKAPYPFLLMNTHKIRDLVKESERFGLPILFIIEVRELYSGRVEHVWMKLNPEMIPTWYKKVCGRKDRGDPFDVNEACFIPRNQFNIWQPLDNSSSML